MKTRILPTLLVGLGGLFLVVAGWLIWQSGARALSERVRLPASLAGLALTSQQFGSEAVAAVTRMHGQEFALVNGAVGMYGPQQNVVLWVSETSSRRAAGGLVDAMRVKIAEGNSPFTPLEARQDGDRLVYDLDGLGLKHFYFQSGRLVVWLAVDAQLADQALQECLEFYP